MTAHQGRKSRYVACHYTSLLAGISDGFRRNTYMLFMYILYLWCEDAILAILCMGLPITITVAGEWLNSLILHDDNKSIAANG